jgi:hypothetical protein
MRLHHEDIYFSVWGCFRTKCRGGYQESWKMNCENRAIEKITQREASSLWHFI